jgi:hypothetical protein
MEASLLKPLISGEDIERYGALESQHLLLFPYELDAKGEARLISADKFQNAFPLAWGYLKTHETELRAREDDKFDDDGWYRFGRHQNLDKHERPKLGCAETVKNLEFALDTKGELYFHNVRVNGVLFKASDQRGQFFLIALLNSHLLDFVFKKGSMRHRGGHYAANKQFIERLPIRRIAFTAPDKDRRQLLEKGKVLFERCLAKNDFLCVTSFVDHCLKQMPEQADVVHDLLAFLAQRMIELNKKKRAEIRSFLEWLEATVGAKVDNLKNKTSLGHYHEGNLENLLETLKENRKALKVNPVSKDFYDALKSAFQESMAKLAPLEKKLATTDRLIDLIVYKLYDLTDEEVTLVEK